VDLFVRFLAVVFILTGLPLFFLFGAALIGFATLGPFRPHDGDKFLLFYRTFGISGLLSASGLTLWAVARIAYPLTRKKRSVIRTGPAD
jgi:hypothetical protein